MSDGGRSYIGKGVEKEVEVVNGKILEEIEGMEEERKIIIEKKMIDIDG